MISWIAKHSFLSFIDQENGQMRNNVGKSRKIQSNHRLPEDLIENLKKIAGEQGVSDSFLVENFIRQGIELTRSSDPVLGKVRVSEIADTVEAVKNLKQRMTLLEAHVVKLLNQEGQLVEHHESDSHTAIETKALVQAQVTAAVAFDQSEACSRALKPHEAHKIAQKYGYQSTIKALSALAKSSLNPVEAYAKLGLKIDLSLRGTRGQPSACFFAINESDLSVLDKKGVSTQSSALLEPRKLSAELKALIDFDDYDADGWLCLAGAYKIACANGYPKTVSNFQAIAHKRNAEAEYKQWGLEPDWSRRSSNNTKSYWLRPLLERAE